MLLAAAALLFTGGARAGEGGDQAALLTLFVNDVKHGEVAVVLRGKDVWIPAKDLRVAGLSGIESLRGRSETLLGERSISLASLAPKIRFAFDEGPHAANQSARRNAPHDGH